MSMASNQDIAGLILTVYLLVLFRRWSNTYLHTVAFNLQPYVYTCMCVKCNL